MEQTFWPSQCIKQTKRRNQAEDKFFMNQLWGEKKQSNGGAEIGSRLGSGSQRQWQVLRDRRGLKDSWLEARGLIVSQSLKDAGEGYCC